MKPKSSVQFRRAISHQAVRPPASFKETGYTVIELVIVIVIVGIIGAVALSRLLRGDSYNPAIARDQLVSMARSAQQKAIGRNDVVMIVQPAGGNLEIRIADQSGVVQESTTALSSVSLRADVNNLASCASSVPAFALSNSAPLEIRFDSLGDIYQAGIHGSPGFPQSISTAVRVCINNEPAFSVCWSPSGYAYVGNCIP